ncbi:DUF485 domain-containing protein [Tomitella biformata]|uniref:DUF485 domain-containing protein n=1 Tax=Tomitella biformata TaxID=630403 RepID=UPI000467626A|nr:DUF485 domain-containing protein [Tomitella biformata]
MSDTIENSSGLPPEPISAEAQAFFDMQERPEFQELRSRLRRFVFPMTAFFLSWYALYVLLAMYATDFMAHKLWGEINVGLVMGLGQFVTTFVIAGLYVRFATRDLDPISSKLRIEMEGKGL